MATQSLEMGIYDFFPTESYYPFLGLTDPILSEDILQEGVALDHHTKRKDTFTSDSVDDSMLIQVKKLAESTTVGGERFAAVDLNSDGNASPNESSHNGDDVVCDMWDIGPLFEEEGECQDIIGSIAKFSAPSNITSVSREKVVDYDKMTGFRSSGKRIPKSVGDSSSSDDDSNDDDNQFGHNSAMRVRRSQRKRRCAASNDADYDYDINVTSSTTKRRRTSDCRTSQQQQNQQEDQSDEEEENDDDAASSNSDSELERLAKLRPAREHRPRQKRCLSKNAIAARENRERHKVYVKTLEGVVKRLKKENKTYRESSLQLKTRCDELTKEMEYLRAVVTGAPTIARLIGRLLPIPQDLLANQEQQGGSSGNVASEDSVPQRDHDYEMKAGSATNSSVSGSGICLHVSGAGVSLELCHLCAERFSSKK